MGKTRELFKKIRDTKGIFHAKMGSIKDRNGRDLTEAEDIMKRWQEYTEELYKKDLHDPDNHNSMITHLEPDILECKIKWALGSRRRKWQPTPILLLGKFQGHRVPKSWTRLSDFPLLMYEMSTIVWCLNILWHCLSLGLE